MSARPAPSPVLRSAGLTLSLFPLAGGAFWSATNKCALFLFETTTESPGDDTASSDSGEGTPQMSQLARSFADLPARYAHAAGVGGRAAESAVASMHWCSSLALTALEAPRGQTIGNSLIRFTVRDVCGASLQLDSETCSMLRSPALRARLDELAAALN